ncbi:MAG: 50S ribosome-binding GTPase [Dehalococcoidia bacterium]|nr:50S ribosome-binding GTPase [Dehalococcoidia bacterium]
MPANLPPHYFSAEKRYREAKDPREKIEALELMLAIMPKHKGTDHLRADLRRRIARATTEAERAASKKGYSYRIRKEGAGQVVLAGLPNVGKSRLLGTLTEASPEVGDYPFTTRNAMPGMMKFENVPIQLVDTNPLNDQNARAWLPSLLRSCDAVLLVVDLSDSPLEQFDAALEVLREFKVVSGTEKEQMDEGIIKLPTLVVANKNDAAGAAEKYKLLSKKLAGSLPSISVSAETDAVLGDLRRQIFNILNIVRVYTKPRSGKADFNDPVILNAGEMVEDFAQAVHKDFRRKLKYANIWGSGKYDGQRVSRDYVLQDGDTLELHI